MDLKKFLTKVFSWESVAKILFWAIAEIIDLLVVGKNLEVKEKKAVQLCYCIGIIYGKTWVAETDTTLDDEGLEKILDKCVDTAAEGNFELPTIPEIG